MCPKPEYSLQERVICLNESNAGAAQHLLTKGWCHKVQAQRSEKIGMVRTLTRSRFNPLEKASRTGT
eukprot:SAG11_NODE_1152_length_5663_cov_110.803379_7_plen_67_part_00